MVKRAISVASSDIDAEDRGEVSIATFDGIQRPKRKGTSSALNHRSKNNKKISSELPMIEPQHSRVQTSIDNYVTDSHKKSKQLI